ncbi:MAG: TAT-variant-translocated molybdopterin oxidoreductase, partial [Bdellovibrionales bacterium]
MDNIDQTKSSAPADTKYWRSLEEWRNDPEFAATMEKEFQTSPLQSSDGEDGWARREFLKLMGASIALTTFGCVRRPAQKIIPYAKKPLDVIHGLPN